MDHFATMLLTVTGQELLMLILKTVIQPLVNVQQCHFESADVKKM